MKLAKKSFGNPYECKYEWDEDCFVQCGESGLVVKSLENALDGDLSEENTYYTTAFFEAFPKTPDTFIRGEGKTVEEAEEQAWDKLQNYLKCTKHKWNPRHYTNGAAICDSCGMFGSGAWGINTICDVCNDPTIYSKASDGKRYCESCLEDNPDRNTEWIINWNIEHFKKHPERLKKSKEDAKKLFETYQKRINNENNI